jgi:hypothetical protein
MTEQQWLQYDDTRLDVLRSSLRMRGCNDRQIEEATNRARSIINLLGRLLCPGDEFGHALTAAQVIVETNMTILKHWGQDALNDFVAVMIKHGRLRLTDEQVDRAIWPEEADGVAYPAHIALMLDAEEAGSIFAACDMLLHNASGDGPYLDAARRVFDRLRSVLPGAPKGGQ